MLGQESSASERGSTYYGMLRMCPHEFGLSQVLGMRRIAEAEQLTLGILYHMAMETYYDAIYDHQHSIEKPKTLAAKQHFFHGNIRNAQQMAWDAVDAIRTEPGYANTWYWLEKTVSAYFETYWKTDEWEVVATEEPIDITIDGVRYTTRLDLVVYDWQRKGYRVGEFKTARFLTNDLVDNYQMDAQVLGEVVGFEKHFGYQKNLLAIDVSIVTKQEQPKVTRVEVYPSLPHIRAWEASLLAFSELRKVYKELGWPRSYKCAGYARGYSKCQFYSVCSMHPHMTVEDWKGSDPPEGYEFTGKVDQDVDD